jgi:deoxyribose-phosphate aldolase
VKTLLPADIDVALWKPAATAAEIQTLCADARESKLRAVCVNSARVALAYAQLEASDVKVVALVGFPFGAADADVKRYETEAAVDADAHEIEIVMNLGLLKDGQFKYSLRELRDVVEAADEHPVCVALETALLTRDEILRAAELIVESGARAIATSTDFWPEVCVSADDVNLLREAIGPKFIVKAVGGIRDAQTALALIAAGADRMGLAHPVTLLNGL